MWQQTTETAQEKRDTVLNGQPLVSLILGPLVLRPKDEGLKDPGLWPKDRGYRALEFAPPFVPFFHRPDSPG